MLVVFTKKIHGRYKQWTCTFRKMEHLDKYVDVIHKNCEFSNGKLIGFEILEE